jgi:hypothetical protein
MASQKPSEDPMTQPKSKANAKSRKTARNRTRPKSSTRSTSVSRKPATRSDTKRAHILAMLRTPSGVTIAAIMHATNWQQHSVRGFLAGVVRRKLGLNLVSEQTDKGRLYRIKDGKTSSAADRAKQAA